MIVVELCRVAGARWRFAIFRVAPDGQTHAILGGTGNWAKVRASAMETASILAALDEAADSDCSEDEPTLDNCTPASGVRTIPPAGALG